MVEDLLTQLRNGICFIQEGSSVPVIGLGGAYEAQIMYINGMIGVAIPCKREEPFLESFAKINIEYLPVVDFGGERKSLLFLYMKHTVDGAKLRSFAAICAEFVDPGQDGETRQLLETDPLKWWLRWKELIGNVNSEHTVYDVLGELMVYSYLLKKGYRPEWTGSSMKRVDLVTEKKSFEVKSSLNRYSTEITVHGQLQLIMEEAKELSLMFCRFEESPSGTTLNEVVGQLVAQGEDEDFLEVELENMGYVRGNSARDKKYALLELRQYKVDEKFPKIVPESFKDDKLPVGITKVVYTVDLSNLKYDVCNLPQV